MYRATKYIFLLMLCLQGSEFAVGQNREPLVGPEHEIEAARKLMRTERKLVIANELSLTPEESKDFWPVYNEYEAAISKIGGEKIDMITGYANNFDKITPEYAERLLRDSFDIEFRYEKTRQSYIKKFKRVLPVIKVVRLYQIDNKFNAALDYQLAARIPLARDNRK